MSNNILNKKLAPVFLSFALAVSLFAGGGKTLIKCLSCDTHDVVTSCDDCPAPLRGTGIYVVDDLGEETLVPTGFVYWFKGTYLYMKDWLNDEPTRVDITTTKYNSQKKMIDFIADCECSARLSTDMSTEGELCVSPCLVPQFEYHSLNGFAGSVQSNTLVASFPLPFNYDGNALTAPTDLTINWDINAPGGGIIQVIPNAITPTGVIDLSSYNHVYPSDGIYEVLLSFEANGLTYNSPAIFAIDVPANALASSGSIGLVNELTVMGSCPNLTGDLDIMTSILIGARGQPLTAFAYNSTIPLNTYSVGDVVEIATGATYIVPNSPPRTVNIINDYRVISCSAN